MPASSGANASCTPSGTPGAIHRMMGDGVGVGVRVCVAVGVGVRDRVGVGVSVGAGAQAAMKDRSKKIPRCIKSFFFV